MSSESTQDTELVRALGPVSATTLVVGSMIGSGIFIVSADIARLVDSPALLIGAWLVTALMTVVGALSYGELAAMMPRAGGQYVFLREALGSLWGFLYGWTLFLVIQTGTIAAVSVAFAKFLGVFVPAVSADHWILGPLLLWGFKLGLNTQNLVAIGVVTVLTLVNIRGVKTGALVQNIFTIAKTAALLGLVLIGFGLASNAHAIAINFGNFWRNVGWQQLFPITTGVDGPEVLVGLFTALAVAQVGSLFAADAWNNVTFTAAEVENPARNLPMALGLGTGIVLLLYIAANFAYMMVLPLEGTPEGHTVAERGIQYATDDRVGTAVMEAAFGPGGAQLMALAIMISTFGCCNGLILAGARVYYAMARDGMFFASVGRLDPVHRTPAVSLTVQALWTGVLCLSGSYGQLLDYIIFAVLVFYILTIVGLFVLRRTRPDAPRPYKAAGYPVLPALYILMALFIDLVLLRYKPQYTWPGLIIVLLGIPVYYLWAHRKISAREESA
ncbi:MAG: amino acid permease [Armatimonadetes bacterium]|nr:amino acid permease [Armatimonadota bacterium]